MNPLMQIFRHLARQPRQPWDERLPDGSSPIQPTRPPIIRYRDESPEVAPALSTPDRIIERLPQPVEVGTIDAPLEAPSVPVNTNPVRVFSRNNRPQNLEEMQEYDEDLRTRPIVDENGRWKSIGKNLLRGLGPGMQQAQVNAARRGERMDAGDFFTGLAGAGGYGLSALIDPTVDERFDRESERQINDRGMARGYDQLKRVSDLEGASADREYKRAVIGVRSDNTERQRLESERRAVRASLATRTSLDPARDSVLIARARLAGIDVDPENFGKKGRGIWIEGIYSDASTGEPILRNGQPIVDRTKVPVEWNGYQVAPGVAAQATATIGARDATNSAERNSALGLAQTKRSEADRLEVDAIKLETEGSAYREDDEAHKLRRQEAKEKRDRAFQLRKEADEVEARGNAQPVGSVTPPIRPKIATTKDVSDYAKQHKISVEEARRMFEAAKYSIK